MHPHLFPIPICSIPLPSLSNGSANPRCYIFYEECQVGLPMNMIWSNSLNFSKLHSLLAIHLLLPPYRSCLACILLIHIHKKKKKKSSILADTETQESFHTKEAQADYIFCHTAAALICLCISLITARSSALCAQCQAAAKPAEGWHSNAACGEQTARERNHRASALLSVRMLDRNR